MPPVEWRVGVVGRAVGGRARISLLALREVGERPRGRRETADGEAVERDVGVTGVCQGIGLPPESRGTPLLQEFRCEIRPVAV
jgi:hypothetical protein